MYCAFFYHNIHRLATVAANPRLSSKETACPLDLSFPAEQPGRFTSINPCKVLNRSMSRDELSPYPFS